MRFCAIFGAVLSLFLASSAVAQPLVQVGRCDLPTANQSYAIFSNGLVQQVGNPGNAGMAARDPTGLTFLRMPSTNPSQAYFVTWNGQLIEIRQGYGQRLVGGCSIALPPPPPPPYFPPISASYGVPIPGGLAALPQTLIDLNNPFAPPMIAVESEVKACQQQFPNLASEGFQDCVVRKMAGSREVAVYDCARRSGNDAVRLATCVVGALGGVKEREIAARVETCRQQYGGDYRQFPLCMAGQQFDPETALLISCLQQQSATGQISAMGTAVCYGGAKLNLNPEAQIAVQCAVATGGEPEAFVGCAGGLLTKRELEKCQANGVGGPNGCFGPNNDIIQHIASGGMRIEAIYGPANPIVHKWNEAVAKLQAGAREEAQQLLKEAANTVAQAPDAAAKAVTNYVSQAMPRITVGKPSVTVGGRRFSF